jgi:hypothetical protein
MLDVAEPRCTAFAGARRLDSGALSAVAASAKRAIDGGEQEPVLIFDDGDARLVEIDFRGSPEAVRESVRQALERRRAGGASGDEEPRRGVGRPRLGVVAREVTLLPRHWAWLSQQPGGASVALRRLVEEASKDRDGRDRRRRAQEAAFRVMSALAGDRVGFEEATRALFAGNAPGFAELVAAWPPDVRDYALSVADGAFGRAAPAP